MQDLIETIHDIFTESSPSEIIGDAIGAICVFAIPIGLLFIGHGLGY